MCSFDLIYPMTYEFVQYNVLQYSNLYFILFISFRYYSRIYLYITVYCTSLTAFFCQQHNRIWSSLRWTLQEPVLHSALQLHVDTSAKAGTLFAIASSALLEEAVVAFPLAFDGAAVKIVVCSLVNRCKGIL